MKSGRKPVLAAAVLKAGAPSACLPFPGPLQAVPTASRPSSALESCTILSKWLSVSEPSFEHNKSPCLTLQVKWRGQRKEGFIKLL